MDSILFHSLGRWRTQLLWRFFGLVLLQSVLLQSQHYNFQQFFRLPLGLHLVWISGLLLVTLGPRLILLIASTLSLYIYLIPIFIWAVELQVSEEYIILLALPTVSLLLILISSWQHRSSEDFHKQIDAGQVCLFRLTIIITMAFACFHKINTDFLNQAVSCGSALTKNLPQWWSLPFPQWLLNINPVVAILVEGLVPTLLFIYPPIGILFTFLGMGIVGHVGPTAFTMLILVLACAFLRHEDKDILANGFKRYSWLLLTLILVMSFVSFRSYIGSKSWLEFLVYQVTLLTLIFGVCLLFSKGIPRFSRVTLFPRNNSLKWILIIFVAVSTLNGFAPYLGLKYRLSFAMLSNLRVDDARWNSVIVPKWVYLRKHDPFIHVTKVVMDQEGSAFMSTLKPKAKRGLYLGLFSPMSLKNRLAVFAKTNAHLDIQLTYQGQSFDFKDATHNQKLLRWLIAIPNTKMIQEWLTIKGPQPCYH